MTFNTHLTKVPCSIILDISAGDTSIKRKKEKQLPFSSSETEQPKHKEVKMTSHTGWSCCHVLRFLLGAHLSYEKGTAGCDLARKEITALVVI